MATPELRNPVPSERRAVRPPVGTSTVSQSHSHRRAHAAPLAKPIARLTLGARNRVSFLLPQALLPDAGWGIDRGGHGQPGFENPGDLIR